MFFLNDEKNNRNFESKAYTKRTTQKIKLIEILYRSSENYRANIRAILNDPRKKGLTEQDF